MDDGTASVMEVVTISSTPPRQSDAHQGPDSPRAGVAAGEDPGPAVDTPSPSPPDGGDESDEGDPLTAVHSDGEGGASGGSGGEEKPAQPDTRMTVTETPTWAFRGKHNRSFAAVHPDLESLASPSPSGEQAGVVGKRGKRKAKKPSQQELLEAQLAEARVDLEARQGDFVRSPVLNRTAFAFAAWLNPETEQQRELAARAHERKLMARRKRRPSEDQLLHDLGRYRYCWHVFTRDHPFVARGITMLTFATWRLFAVLDFATDAMAAANVNKFSAVWGFFLVLLLFVPYIVCSIGLFNVALREIPAFLRKNRIEVAGVEPIMAGYIAGAPLWTFLMDAYVTIRFAFWPVAGHYAVAFDRMRRITMLFVEVGVATIFQLQIMSTGITGVQNNLLAEAIAISFVNLAINGTWLYRKITAQHRPWTRYIKDSFRAGLSSIPRLDDIRDGVERLEYFTEVQHWTDLTTITSAIMEAEDTCRLRYLTVNRGNITDEGANVMVACLTVNTTITSLTMDHNEVCV